MEWITIFFIALSLAMDAFAVSIANGVSVSHLFWCISIFNAFAGLVFRYLCKK